MVQNSAVGFGSLIADDMGLGKTVQVIAAILRFKQMGALRKKKVLVIMPTTSSLWLRTGRPPLFSVRMIDFTSSRGVSA